MSLSSFIIFPNHWIIIRLLFLNLLTFLGIFISFSFIYIILCNRSLGDIFLMELGTYLMGILLVSCLVHRWNFLMITENKSLRRSCKCLEKFFWECHLNGYRKLLWRVNPWEPPFLTYISFPIASYFFLILCFQES